MEFHRLCRGILCDQDSIGLFEIRVKDGFMSTIGSELNRNNRFGSIRAERSRLIGLRSVSELSITAASSDGSGSVASGRCIQSEIVRAILLLGGCCTVILGVIGIVVPGLPTTPFLLLACWCFSRSSPRIEAMILNSRLLGPIIADWRQHRQIQRRVQVFAVFSVLVMLFVTCRYSDIATGAKAAIFAVGCIGMSVVCCLPVRRNESA